MDLKNNYNSFTEFYRKKALKGENVDIFNEISKELDSCLNNSLKKILSEKGFFSYIISIFSNISYFDNLITIINEYFSKENKYIFEQINNYFSEYMNDIKNLVCSNSNSIAFMYNNEQKDSWEKLGSIYKNKRDLIYKNLNKLLEKK